MKKCLIYLEANCIQDGIDLLEVIRQYYSIEDGENCEIESYGVLLNYDASGAIGHFDNIIHINSPSVQDFDLARITELLYQICESNHFDMILIPSTWQGRMLAPRLAIRLNVGLTADVTEIRHEEQIPQMVRPAYSGRLLAGIVSCSEGPIMMSVRPGVFKHSILPLKNTKIIHFAGTLNGDCGIAQISSEEKVLNYDIRNSDVLIAGGNGIIKNFSDLETLAELLGGHVAASRKVVDSGKASRVIQVGQSGKTVSPKLYIALGIYGSIQHVEGLKNVQYIISVNTNEKAPICSLSDLVVVGDAAKFNQMLIKGIQQYKDEQPI